MSVYSMDKTVAALWGGERGNRPILQGASRNNPQIKKKNICIIF